MPSKTTASKTTSRKTAPGKTTSRKAASSQVTAPVREEDIALKAKKTDLTRLKRYVKEQGQGAVPFLQRALDEGNFLLRHAAAEALGVLAPGPTERRLMEQLSEKGKKSARAESEREVLLMLLLALATPTAIRTFVRHEQRVEHTVGERVREALFVYAASAVDGMEEAGARELLRQLGLRGHAEPFYEPPARSAGARALAEALLAHDSLELRREGGELLGHLDGVAALASLRERGVVPSVETVQMLCSDASPETQFEVLSPYAGSPEGREMIVASLSEKPDQRWLEVLDPHLDDPRILTLLQSLHHPAVLRRLRARAETPPFHGDARRACYELGQAGDPAAAPILMRWLRDPVAREASPMLLTALAACGDASVIPELNELKKTEPTRAGFYDSTIAELRERE